MEKTAKLVSFQAKIYNGAHQKMYENFKFIMTWDNGDVGVGLSKTQAGIWIIGTIYVYQWVQGKYDIEFKAIKDPSKPAYDPNQRQTSKSSSGYKKSPEEQKRIINQVALIGYNSCMLNLITTDKDDNKVAVSGNDVYLAFREWMYNKIFNLSEEPITLQGVFKIACENIGVKSDQVTIQDVLTKADALLNAVKNITWNNPAKVPVNQPPQNNSQPQEQRENPQQTTPQPESPPTEAIPPTQEEEIPPKAFVI